MTEVLMIVDKILALTLAVLAGAGWTSAYVNGKAVEKLEAYIRRMHGYGGGGGGEEDPVPTTREYERARQKEVRDAPN
jgi:hypothetical protein